MPSTQRHTATQDPLYKLFANHGYVLNLMYCKLFLRQAMLIRMWTRSLEQTPELLMDPHLTDGVVYKVNALECLLLSK